MDSANQAVDEAERDEASNVNNARLENEVRVDKLSYTNTAT